MNIHIYVYIYILHSFSGDSTAYSLGKLILCWFHIIHCYTDTLPYQFLTEELSGLKHEGDVIKWSWTVRLRTLQSNNAHK